MSADVKTDADLEGVGWKDPAYREKRLTWGAGEVEVIPESPAPLRSWEEIKAELIAQGRYRETPPKKWSGASRRASQG